MVSSGTRGSQGVKMTINWDFFKLAGIFLVIPLVFVIIAFSPLWVFLAAIVLMVLTFLYFLIVGETGHPFRKVKR